MAAPEPTQSRQAALLLHGLPPTVRRQVLARLDAAESARLKPLLEELAKLGVSPSMSRQLEHLTSQPAPRKSDTSVLSAQDRVERLSADDVFRCLQTCAPMTVAKLLRARAWPWQAELLERMSDARRVEVLECMRSESPPLAPAMLRILCERLCAEAARAPVDEPTASLDAGKRRGIGARLKRWFGWTR